MYLYKNLFVVSIVSHFVPLFSPNSVPRSVCAFQVFRSVVYRLYSDLTLHSELQCPDLRCCGVSCFKVVCTWTLICSFFQVKIKSWFKHWWFQHKQSDYPSIDSCQFPTKCFSFNFTTTVADKDRSVSSFPDFLITYLQLAYSAQ